MSNEQLPNPQSIEDELAAQREAAFSAVAEFAASPDRQFAAGPDIRKATGLGQMDVQNLGYGSYAELESDAVAWKAEQDANRDAAEAEAIRQDERRMEREERQQRAKEQSEAWLSSTHEYRAKKAEADRMVTAIGGTVIDRLAEPDADKIAYKAKISGLGQQWYDKHPDQEAKALQEATRKARTQKRREVESDPELAAKVREQAINIATEGGYATGHLQPTHYEVTRNKAAEARTSDLASLLKAHDKDVLSAQERKTRAVTDEALEMNREFDEKKAYDADVAEAYTTQKDLDHEEAIRMTQESDEVDGFFEFFKGGDRKHTPKRLMSYLGKKLKSLRANPRAAVTGSIAAASEYLRSAPQALNEYYLDPKNGRKRVLLGAAAVGAMFIAQRLEIEVGAGGSELATATAGAAEAPAVEVAGKADVAGGTTADIGGDVEKLATPKEAMISSENPTLSHLAVDNLRESGQQITPAAIEAEWHRIQELNNISDEELTELQSGRKVRVS